MSEEHYDLTLNKESLTNYLIDATKRYFIKKGFEGEESLIANESYIKDIKDIDDVASLALAARYLANELDDQITIKMKATFTDVTGKTRTGYRVI